jgi:hypothetical protein
MTPLTHISHTLRQVGDGFQQGECFWHSKIESPTSPHNRKDQQLTWLFIKHCDTATNSLNGSANIEKVADGMTTALDLQKPLINDLHGQGAQMVLTLKMTLILKLQ